MLYFPVNSLALFVGLEVTLVLINCITFSLILHLGLKKYINHKERGDNGLSIIQVPKVLKETLRNVFLFVGLTTLRTFNFDWLIP